MGYNNNYPLQKSVLVITNDGVRDILRYTNRSRQLELNTCITELVSCYLGKSLCRGNGDVDFDDPIYQACYVFLYFPVLCHGIYDGLLQFYSRGCFGTLLGKAILSGCLRVCALGGGPGTDLFGVRMFLNNTGCQDVQIEATVLDRHPTWNIAFHCLESNLYQPSNLSADYSHLEASRSVLQSHLQTIADADLITCSKFISAVKALPNSKATLLKILNHVKPDAYIFYLDNSKGDNTEFFRLVAQRAGFTEVFCFERNEDNPFQLPNTEQSCVLRDLSTWFNFNSQRNLRVTFMLWRKNARIVTSAPRINNSYVDSLYYRLQTESRLIRQHGVVTSNSSGPKPTVSQKVTENSGRPSYTQVSSHNSSHKVPIAAARSHKTSTDHGSCSSYGNHKTSTNYGNRSSHGTVPTAAAHSHITSTDSNRSSHYSSSVKSTQRYETSIQPERELYNHDQVEAQQSRSSRSCPSCILL